MSQWEEELLCRGHVLALESGDEGGIHGNLVMRLVRPSKLLGGGRIAADRVDLLLVDEFTKLQVQVREDLIVAARTIPNVIAMTATPALHHARTRRELMALLEPEADRIARAEDRDILKILTEREASARDEWGAELQDASKRRAVEETFGLYRRLIRTARTDYPDALPKRNYQPIKLAPTDGDVERARATRALSRCCARCQSGASPRRAPPGLRAQPAVAATAPQHAPTDHTGAPGGMAADRPLPARRTGRRKARCTNRPFASVPRQEPDWACRRRRRGQSDHRLSARCDREIDRHAGCAEAPGRLVPPTNSRSRSPCSRRRLDDFISGEARILVAADAAREGP